MKRLIKKLTAIITFCIVILTTSGIVNAAGTGSLTIKITPDASKAIEDKKVYVYLSLTNFENVETSEPMALTGVLNYDKNIFENATFEGLNNWIAGFNPENGNITLDTSSITENANIARITLDVKDVSKSFTTDIKVNDITLTNGENVDMQNMNLNARVSITVGQEQENPDDNNQNNNNNQDEEDNSNTNGNEENNNQQENNQNDNNYENNNQENNDNQDLNNNNNNNNGNNQNNNNNQETDKIEKVEDLTTSKDPLPQTGVNYTIVGIIISVFILGVISLIGFKRLEK